MQLAVDSMSAVTWLAFGGPDSVGIPTDLTLASDLAFVFNTNWMSLGALLGALDCGLLHQVTKRTMKRHKLYCLFSLKEDAPNKKRRRVAMLSPTLQLSL